MLALRSTRNGLNRADWHSLCATICTSYDLLASLSLQEALYNYNYKEALALALLTHRK